MQPNLCFLLAVTAPELSGMESFASHLIALGARHVIAALWPVDDAATHALAVATHAALHAARHHPKPWRLRKARCRPIRATTHRITGPLSNAIVDDQTPTESQRKSAQDDAPRPCHTIPQTDRRRR